MHNTLQWMLQYSSQLIRVLHTVKNTAQHSTAQHSTQHGDGSELPDRVLFMMTNSCQFAFFYNALLENSMGLT